MHEDEINWGPSSCENKDDRNKFDDEQPLYCSDDFLTRHVSRLVVLVIFAYNRIRITIALYSLSIPLLKCLGFFVKQERFEIQPWHASIDVRSIYLTNRLVTDRICRDLDEAKWMEIRHGRGSLTRIAWKSSSLVDWLLSVICDTRSPRGTRNFIPIQPPMIAFDKWDSTWGEYLFSIFADGGDYGLQRPNRILLLFPAAYLDRLNK